jgi:hypothetical protein
VRTPRWWVDLTIAAAGFYGPSLVLAVLLLTPEVTR